MCHSSMDDGAFRVLDKPVQVMDETAVARNSNYQKPNEGLDIDVVAYNINDLPDVILEHILSFVPMKDAVRTCVLSKKWQYLWTFCPNVELCEWQFSWRGQFTNFVDRVLDLQCSSCIKRLVLTCRVLGNASNVNSWVSTAVKRNVKDFTLRLSCIQGNFVLPYCLFTCATLTRLTLFFSGALNLPSSILLPNLKLLHLVEITFVDERSTEQLLSSPVLEELNIIRCNWDNLKTMTICTPMLKILKICDKDLDGSLIHPYGCRVLIYGNNLERIHCRSSFLNDYQVERSCLLVKAHINVRCCHPRRIRQVAYSLHKLLKRMCSVKKLKLSSTAVKVLSSVDELCSHLPVFPNLKILDFEHLDLKLQVIIKLLHNAPHLETLRLREGIKPYSSDDEDGVILDPVPHCFSSHLRQIEIFDSFPFKEEVCMLEFMLKHAMVLEKFMIYRRWAFPGLGFEENFHKKLLEMCSESKSFQITVIYPKASSTIY
ncbi:hypothetical protein BT93_E2134 [Corymbia citriodora subsp. variegata]|nr:hypothetical protein BT93_E2134 [Corymbia citriodora subsp. variegata]